MKRLATLLVPLALIATCAGCAARRHAAPPDPNAAARTPEDVDRLFGERLNAGDVDGVVALYEPNATLVRQDRTAAMGTAAIREEIAAAVALRPQIKMGVFRVLMGGNDVAVLYNDFHATGTDRDGKHVDLSGHASEVVRRQHDGTWRFVVDDPDARSVACAPHPWHRPPGKAPCKAPCKVGKGHPCAHKSHPCMHRKATK
jgi:ketosteroid isomerase-like protein